MKNLKALSQLLSDFEDIDNWSYEFIKPAVQKGIYLPLSSIVAQNVIGPTLGAKRVPLILDLLNTLVFKITYKAYSSIDHPFKIRRNCHKVIVLEDEVMEIDIVLKDKNKRMGIRQINFKNLKEASEVPDQIFMDRFFAQEMMESKDVLIWLRIPQFSKTREHFEEKEHVFNSRQFYDILTSKSSWNTKLSMMIFEGQETTEMIYLRSALWGYGKDYWDKYMIGQDIISFYENKLQLTQLNLRDLLLLEEFVANFGNSKVSNEEILTLSNKSRMYEQRVAKLIKQIEEYNYVEN